MRTIRTTIALLALGFAASLAAAVHLVPVVGGLASPVFAGNAGDGSGRLFIIEQGGVIRVLQSGAATASVFLDIRSKVIAGGERGLLGLAFHPQYASNGRFFVYYTRSGDGTIVVAEYGTLSDRNVASAIETTLLAIPHPINANHNGGMLAFGRDGYLYIGVGDGGSANDPPDNAQNLESLLGKILRIDVDRTASGLRYALPPDNPFVNTPGRDEIYAYGLRNPWRFTFDGVTDVLWVADVGQNAREEVNMPVVRGGNYGWRCKEGTLDTTLMCGTPTAPLVPPVAEYVHPLGQAVTGGFVYHGAAIPGLVGQYVFADYSSGFVWHIPTNTVPTRMIVQADGWDSGTHPASFAEDTDGELYLVDPRTSYLWKLIPAP